MKKLKFYLIRIYRLALNFKKQEEIVWSDLKKLHSASDWQSGIYEKEKYIETFFQIGDEKGERFFYAIDDGYFDCRVQILGQFPVNLTSDIFILATHFNNLLTNGGVLINVNDNYVEFRQKREWIIHLLYPSEIYNQLSNHFSASKDIYTAFQRLVDGQEAPAIIIADFLKEKRENNDEA
tara:strand:+ start:4467 stop:5006 length:540 start_codon:yes stop_codon:yes gene_type:complete